MPTPAVVIAGVSSGVGKTSVAVGIMAALTKRGVRVQPFKVGPDFLDPMHHTQACGVASVNLDSFMMGRDEVLATFHRACAGADIAVIEGCMGLYDGSDGATEGGSSAEIAKWLNAPVVLVLDAWCIGRSVAAMVHGYASFDPDVVFAGVVFNKIGGDAHDRWLRDAIASSPLTAAVPVLGCLPKTVGAAVPERHLGLHMPTDGDRGHIEVLARLLEGHFDLDALQRLLVSAPPPTPPLSNAETFPALPPVRLGVAKDDAFCFYYADNLRVLAQLGCTIEFFSPLHDARVPDVHALYFGGGYPELHAAALEANAAMRLSVHAFAASGRLVYAECGGLMYLAQRLIHDGTAHAMVGVLPIDVTMTPRMTMGYCVAQVSSALAALLQLPEGTSLACQQFHFSEMTHRGEPAQVLDARGTVVGLRGIDTPAYATRMERPGAPTSPEGVVQGGTIASYCHLHFGAHREFATALIATARRSMTVASFEPSATELLGAIWDSPLPGETIVAQRSRRADKKAQLGGVSEFCDAPASLVAGTPRLTKSLITATTSEAIEAQVQAFHAQGVRDLHTIDTALLAQVSPGVVFTQDSCARCSAVDSAVAVALDAAGVSRDTAVAIQPRTVTDILATVTTIGRVVGEDARAARLHAQLQARLDAVAAIVAPLRRPRVLGLESVFPLVASGQWLPDMRQRAGGMEALTASTPGCPPRRLSWANDVAVSAPDVIVVACCGRSAVESVRDMEAHLATQEGFWDLPALRASPPRLYAVDHGVLSRPGPQVVEGIELLAAIFHPQEPWVLENLKGVNVLQYQGPRFCDPAAFAAHFRPVLLAPAEPEAAPWPAADADGPSLAAHALVAHGTEALYAVGGEDATSARSADVWRWTPKESWRRVPCSTVYGEAGVPNARSNHAAAVWRDVLMVFGGWDQPGLRPLAILELLDLRTRCWTHGSTTGAPPSPRGNPTLVVDHARGFAVLFGGWDKVTRFNDVHVLDLATWAWHDCSSEPAPAPRTDHAAVWWRDCMVVVGGSTREGPVNDVWMWHPDTRWWEQMHCTGDIPVPRTSHAVALVGDRLILSGGQSHVCGTTVFASCYALDLTTREWTALPSFPSGRCRHSAAVLGDSVYVHGGYDGHLVLSGLHSISDVQPAPTPVQATTSEKDAPAAVSWAPSRPLTLEDLRVDVTLAEELAEIDEMEVDEQDGERYRLLHRVACDRGYLQYVDPASGYTVFTSLFLKKRACCGFKCRHCPWGHKNVGKQKTEPMADLDW
ncbi:hypothetical protein ACHHYP_04373 [Achlya hypogyna]|uniref:Uncharacterized protein n=1 Tax=Achlya hypogyna TaxID=1202772 RepID=A0A1V9Z189_ACHHY|nr:hypothetical protein ACHHYP_04373 [Achlya hypogyna]